MNLDEDIRKEYIELFKKIRKNKSETELNSRETTLLFFYQRNRNNHEFDFLKNHNKHRKYNNYKKPEK